MKPSHKPYLISTIIKLLNLFNNLIFKRIIKKPHLVRCDSVVLTFHKRLFSCILVYKFVRYHLITDIQ